MYIILTRNNTGAYEQKIKLDCDLEFAKMLLHKMMQVGKACRGEIIEGERDYLGDFHVQPLWRTDNADANK